MVARAIIEDHYRTKLQVNVYPWTTQCPSKRWKISHQNNNHLYRPLSNPLGGYEGWTWIIIMNLEYGAKPDKQSFSCHSYLSEDKIPHVMAVLSSPGHIHDSWAAAWDSVCQSQWGWVSEWQWLWVSLKRWIHEIDCRNHVEQDFTCCNIQCVFCTKFILCE